MSNRQIVLGKGGKSHNSKSRADSLARGLTGSASPPKLQPLSLKKFVASSIKRDASEKRNNMAVVAIVQGVSIEINYGYTTPVFFAVTNQGKAMIDLPLLTVCVSTLPPQQLQYVLQWAQGQTAALSREWSKTQSGLPVGTVP